MPAPGYDYIAYIDEAGDPGVKAIESGDKKGATEWFSVGCAVIAAKNEAEPIEFVRRARDLIGARQRPDIHYKFLKDWQRNRVCAELAKENVRLFAVVSNKRNMENYRNPNAAAKTLHPNNWFYNYCIRILLERVSDWVERRSFLDHKDVRKVKLVFSRRGGHSYRHVQTYAQLLEKQIASGKLFQTKRAPSFSVLSTELIEVIQHDQLAGLQLADIVASAFYNAAHTGSSTWDTGPAKALQPRVARLHDEHHNQGLTLLPWKNWTLNLSNEQKEIFRFYGYRI
ncbi:DUF3800 domain-containing protein [Ensifer adhaerens]|uniref:DUF3800 domain-containing protein n=1 Tax=Ensifer adhaerens TaxID=106592 RepID=UPI0013315F33|nr:DUF3800 domain-containing protein [Ensifer adhaerens]